jgi:hypothetical protein
MDIKQYQKEYYSKNKLRLSAQKAEWYKKNRDRIVKRQAIYVKKNKKIINIKRKMYPSYKKQYEKRKYYPYPYTDTYKQRQKVRRKLRYAVQKGILIRLPCIKCGQKSEAHHPDYTKPLDVIWLCRLHHTELHKNKV